MKYLKVRMPNSERWIVPCHIIAHNRACYYVEVDIKRGTITESKRDEIYKELYDDAMEDTYEIVDWAANNMDWEDVKPFATNLGIEPMDERDYQEGWCNGEKEIVELNEII